MLRHVAPVRSVRSATYATLVGERADTAQSRRAQARQSIAHIDSATSNQTLLTDVLTDSFKRGHDYLRISLTERCNLRCTYCMPAEGVPLGPKENMLSTSEILRLASVFVRQGVSKIRLTGGEPTLRADLADIIRQLSQFHGLLSIGLTTNGIATERKLPLLVNAGLTHLNLSLDTLDPFKFEIMTRRRGHASVLSALDKAISLLPPKGSTPVRHQNLFSVKLNVVIIKGVNDMELPSFIDLASKSRVSIRFIEYMPFDDNSWSTSKLIPSSDLLAKARELDPSIVSLSSATSDTAKDYAGVGWKGSIGFISSMTDHFCAGCSRLRLTADGRMKACLFGEPKLNLRELMRSGCSDAELLSAIENVVKSKRFAHDGKSSPSAIAASRGALPMSHIGGLLINHLKSTSNAGVRYLCTTRTEKPEAKSGHTPRLSHIDEKTGKPKMVDVSEKAPSKRTAIAAGTVHINKTAFELIKQPGSNRKGDVLAVAQLAGIMAAKQTANLIPLCHPLLLNHVKVELAVNTDTLHQPQIDVIATVSCTGNTGVEMEALTAVSVACLTVWDMLKAVGQQEMRIAEIRLVSKTGGKSDIVPSTGCDE